MKIKIQNILNKLNKKQLGIMLILVIIGIVIVVFVCVKPKVHADGWATNKAGEIVYYQDNQLAIGWQTINGQKCYFNDNGIMQTGFVRIESDMYYFDQKGVMRTGWQEIEGKKYYLNEDGRMQTGLVKVDGAIYCLCDRGALFTGEKEINGVVYTFGEDGKLQLKEGEISVDLKDDNGNIVIVITREDGTKEESQISYEEIGLNDLPNVTTSLEESPKQSTNNQNSSSGSTPTPDPTPTPTPEPTFSMTMQEIYQYALNYGIQTYGLSVNYDLNLNNSGWGAQAEIGTYHTREEILTLIQDEWYGFYTLDPIDRGYNIVVTQEQQAGSPVIRVYFCY